MKDAKNHTRQVQILHLLRSREWVSATSLAERFQVAERTIYRDIEKLGDEGIPIESETGPQGGYRLASDQPLSPLTLDGDDAMRLYLVGLLAKSATDAPSSEGTEPGGYKLNAVKRLAQRIYFDTADWYWRDEASGLLPTVKLGLLTGVALKITIDVKGREGSQVSIVKPYGIVWKAGEWHLVAQPIDGPIQRYRMNLVKSISTTDLTFPYPEDFHLQAWWSQAMEEYGKGEIEIELHVSPKARDELLRLTLKSTSKIERTPGGGLIVRLYVDNWQWLIPLVASFGDALVVRAPEELRNAIAKHHEDALSTYGLSVTSAVPPESRKAYQNDDSRLRSTRGRTR